MSYGPWFMAGHVETGGDDSFKYVPERKKLILKAKRRIASQPLEQLFTSVKALVDCLSKPPCNEMKRNVRFLLSEPSALMIQPGLWSHTVIILFHGPALVVRFEGKLKDDKRRNQVHGYYSSDMDQNKIECVVGKCFR